MKSSTNMQNSILQELAEESHDNKAFSLYRIISLGILGIFLATALWLSKIDTSTVNLLQNIKRKFTVKNELMLSQLKEKEKPKPAIKKKAKPKKVVKKPALKAQAKNQTASKRTPSKKQVRKVYGVRKLYSKGLGSGAGGGVVVGKLGNSLDVPPDTLKATHEDLKGKVTSVTKVTSMPEILRPVKPKYSDLMKQNNVRGRVKARVLVDVDGKAKKIVIVKHLGYGTQKASVEAIRKMKFRPGTIAHQPVAVWIPLTFRFEFQV